MKSLALRMPFVFAAFLFVFLFFSVSCADFWHDACNRNSPPPETPILPRSGAAAISSRAITEAEAVQKMTQKIIMRLSGRSVRDVPLALTGEDSVKPRMRALYENLLRECIASAGSRYVLLEKTEQRADESLLWTVSIVEPVSGAHFFQHSIPIRPDAR